MTPHDVACFSYLAAVHTLRVPHMPLINYGVEVQSTNRFLAGDGPIVAGAIAALNQAPVLLANPVGDDPEGWPIVRQLRRWGVPTSDPTPMAKTRVNIVACDAEGNRTWFSGLRGIETSLLRIDLSPVAAASAAYIDCYEVLGDAPRRVAETAVANGTEIYLNLGGGPPPAWLTTGRRRKIARVVQTNAAETDLGGARKLTEELRDLGVADISVVTVGRHGAFAVEPRGPIQYSTALNIDVRQVQGAGSVFSAAFIDGLRADRRLDVALNRACVAGSLWCSRGESDPFPRADELTKGLADRP